MCEKHMLPRGYREAEIRYIEINKDLIWLFNILFIFLGQRLLTAYIYTPRRKNFSLVVAKEKEKETDCFPNKKCESAAL